MPNTFRNRDIARKAGAKSKRGKAKLAPEWVALRDAILNKHTRRFNKILDELQPTDFVKTYLEVLKYFKPRLSNIEVEQQQPPPQILPFDPYRLRKLSTDKLIEQLKQIENGDDDHTTDVN